MSDWSRVYYAAVYMYTCINMKKKLHVEKVSHRRRSASMLWSGNDKMNHGKSWLTLRYAERFIPSTRRREKISGVSASAMQTDEIE